MKDFSSFTKLNAPDWLDGSGPESEIVLSSRVRLARNFAGCPFPHQMTESELNKMKMEVSSQITSSAKIAPDQIFDLEKLSPTQRIYLKEMFLTGSRALKKPSSRVLYASAGFHQTILVNAEDHLQLAAFSSGLATEKALADVLKMDQSAEELFKYAFDPELGYLTTCPENVGTGMKVSVLAHLPALVMIGEIDKVINALRQLQFSVEGYDGQGSAVRGDIFQIFNLSTLGSSEQDIVKDFTYHIRKLITYEQQAREQLMVKNKLALTDTAWRALAVLKNCHLITAQETIERLSSLRLGTNLGVVPPMGLAKLNWALIGSRTAHLEIEAGSCLNGLEKTKARANWLREYLATS